MRQYHRDNYELVEVSTVPYEIEGAVGIPELETASAENQLKPFSKEGQCEELSV